MFCNKFSSIRPRELSYKGEKDCIKYENALEALISKEEYIFKRDELAKQETECQKQKQMLDERIKEILIRMDENVENLKNGCHRKCLRQFDMKEKWCFEFMGVAVVFVENILLFDIILHVKSITKIKMSGYQW